MRSIFHLINTFVKDYSIPITLTLCKKYEYSGAVVLLNKCITFGCRIHPLAGQGANMGYRDVKNLTRAIEQSIYEGKDFGESLYY